MTYDHAAMLAIVGFFITAYGGLAYMFAGTRRIVAAAAIVPGLTMLAIGCFYASATPGKASFLALPRAVLIGA